MYRVTWYFQGNQGLLPDYKVKDVQYLPDIAEVVRDAFTAGAVTIVVDKGDAIEFSSH